MYAVINSIYVGAEGSWCMYSPFQIPLLHAKACISINYAFLGVVQAACDIGFLVSHALTIGNNSSINSTNHLCVQKLSSKSGSAHS